MQGTLNNRGHGRAARLAALLTLAFFATPLAFAQATSASAPPPPQVTSPLPNSRLPDPSRITIRGTASDLVRGSVKLQMSHVKNGGRVSDKTVSNGINPDRSGNWSVTMDLPKAQRGWQDVRYTITASVRWKNEHNQPHISDAWSPTVTFDVYPQSQPEPLPVAPGPPVIQTPTPGTLLKREGNFRVTGTGTPGNTIDVRTELIYATESNPTYEHKNSSAGIKATIDRSGNWTVTTSAPGYTERDYVNARVVIAARERHREDQSLASHETLREVSIEVPPRREPTQAEKVRAAILSDRPEALAMAESRMGKMDPKLVAAALRPQPRITEPQSGASVDEKLAISGTAAPGSRLQVKVTQALDSLRPRSGKRTPARTTDLGTFTSKANSKGEWKINPVALPDTARRASTITISVVELDAPGGSSTPHTIEVRQQGH